MERVHEAMILDWVLVQSCVSQTAAGRPKLEQVELVGSNSSNSWSVESKFSEGVFAVLDWREEE